jgi:DNA-binding transcriptional LysR family regulator
MDLRQLRYFLQIVDSGSLSRASEILRIAQPSLSLQLKALEDELGTTLLIRHPRGVTPTDLGLLLCDHARKILREVDHAKDAIQSQIATPLGKVIVGLPTSACRGLTVPFMDALAGQFPSISLHIVESMTGFLDEWIRSGRLDVAVLYDPRSSEHVFTMDILTEELCLLASPAAGFRTDEAVPFEKIWRLPLVLPGASNVLRTLMEQMAVRAGVEPGPILDCDSLPSILEMVKQGHFTIMPRFAATAEIGRGEIIALPITDPTPSWTLSIAISNRALNPRASEAVAELLVNVIRDLVQDGRWQATLSRERARNGKRAGQRVRA